MLTEVAENLVHHRDSELDHILTGNLVDNGLSARKRKGDENIGNAKRRREAIK